MRAHDSDWIRQNSDGNLNKKIETSHVAKSKLDLKVHWKLILIFAKKETKEIFSRYIRL